MRHKTQPRLFKNGDKVVSIHDSTYKGTVTKTKYVPGKGLSGKEYQWLYLDGSDTPCGNTSEHFKLDELDENQSQHTQNISTLQEAKDEIARSNGKESWDKWGYEFSEPYGKEIPSRYLEQATELYVKSKYSMIDELLGALKYARRFLNKNDVDINYIDEIIKTSRTR